MPHSSGGGSHSGGSHGGSHHSSHGGSGGSSGPRYSSRPFPNSRRFRYYDRHGRENYIYCSEVPRKSSVFSLILNFIFFIPFIGAGLFTLILFLNAFLPPSPLKPVYEQSDVHIIDEADVIDNEDSLEEVLQEFEDLTGISPYVMTVYDSKWANHYDFLSDYAYSMYLNTFSDEQHFLIVYSEPENAEELDFVDWSWEAIQGDETDKILTENNFGKFSSDLQDDFLRDNVSVGEAFENAFANSLTYMMKGDRSQSMPIGFFTLFWNFFVGIFIVSSISNFIKGRRDYQEVPFEGAGNTGYQNSVPYQNNTTFQGDANYQNNMNYGANVYQGNLNGAQFNGNTAYNNGTQYNGNTAYNNGTQYNGNSAYNNGSQYNSNSAYNSGTQFNAQGSTNSNYFNDDARFRSPDYYDDDARYRGSTAYDGDKQ